MTMTTEQLRRAFRQSHTLDLSDGPHKFASTQIPVGSPLRDDIQKFIDSIPADEVDPTDGKETDPHVTVKYGLHSDDPSPVRGALKGMNRPKVKLGKMKIFPANDHRPSDVVHVEVISPDMHKLNKAVSESGPHTDTHPTYQPHLTLAYLKPGMGKKYEGRTDFDGKEFSPQCVHFSPKDGDKIPLSFADTPHRRIVVGPAKSLNLARESFRRYATAKAREAFRAYAASVAKPEVQTLSAAVVDGREILYLMSDGGKESLALTLGSDLPKKRNGFECFYYWRPVIRDGSWHHPTKNFTVNVDEKQREKWADNFKAMRKNGDEEPVVKDHDTKDSEATLGYVVDVRQNGPWYEELHQYLGEDAKETALKNKLSVGIDPDYVDSKRRKYGSAITHCATTSRPVVPGQGDAVAA